LKGGGKLSFKQKKKKRKKKKKKNQKKKKKTQQNDHPKTPTKYKKKTPTPGTSKKKTGERDFSAQAFKRLKKLQILPDMGWGRQTWGRIWGGRSRWSRQSKRGS